MKQKERSKTMVAVRFAMVIVASLVIGGILGYCIGGSDGLGTTMQAINMWLLSNAVFLMAGSWLFLVATIVFYGKGKRLAAQVTEEDEKTFEQADVTYSISLCLSQIFFTLLYVFFALGVAAFPILKKEAFMPLIVMLAQLVIGMIVGCIMQAKVVNATKQLYPEKQGNVWDTRFQKDWYASCDEAERQMVGQAAFSSHKTMSTLYMVGFVVCCLMCMVMPIGAFPVLMFGALWAAHTLSYQVAALKVERNQRNR